MPCGYNTNKMRTSVTEYCQIEQSVANGIKFENIILKVVLEFWIYEKTENRKINENIKSRPK